MKNDQHNVLGDLGKVRVYASSSAVLSEAVYSRSGALTLMIDMALAVGARKFDWNNKIQFQLTDRELPVWGAVVTNRRREAVFAFHGDQRNKSMEIKTNDRSPGLMIKLKMDGTLIAAPIAPEDQFWLACQYLTLLKARVPDVDALGLMSLHRDLLAS